MANLTYAPVFSTPTEVSHFPPLSLKSLSHLHNLPYPPPPGPLASLSPDSFWVGLYHYSLHPAVPIVFSTLYLVVVELWNRKVKADLRRLKKLNEGRDEKDKIKPNDRLRTGAGKWFVFVHSALLAIYSAWAWLSTAPLVLSAFAKGFYFAGFNGLRQAYCDPSYQLWDQVLGWQGWLFYISKFVEVIDTAILLLKAKPAPILQTYHHWGAILSMWSQIRFHAQPVWVWVSFNAAIHTAMYFYFSLAAIDVPAPKILKQTLTTAQILQFLVGGSLQAGYFFVKGPSGDACLRTDGQKLATSFLVAYLTPLTYLFVKFYIESYYGGGKPKGKKFDATKERKAA